MNNPYLNSDLDGWERCHDCRVNKAQLEFANYSTEELRVTRRVVDGLAQSIDDIYWEPNPDRSHCYAAILLCYACAARRHGGPYLHSLGLIDWTDDPADEPDPAPHWHPAEQEAWLRRRAERREVADRRLLDHILTDDMFADAPLDPNGDRRPHDD